MMLDTMTRWLAGIGDTAIRWELRKIFLPIVDRDSSCPLNSAGLVIKAGASALAKSGAADCYLLANGILRKVTAATDMPALVGTVANATFNVFCFFIDTAGVVTSQMGTAGSTLAKVQFPQFPTQKALIGFVIINPTGTGPFIGGTTALDDATVAPNAAYISPIGGFDPYVLIG